MIPISTSLIACWLLTTRDPATTWREHRFSVRRLSRFAVLITVAAVVIGCLALLDDQNPELADAGRRISLAMVLAEAPAFALAAIQMGRVLRQLAGHEWLRWLWLLGGIGTMITDVALVGWVSIVWKMWTPLKWLDAVMGMTLVIAALASLWSLCRFERTLGPGWTEKKRAILPVPGGRPSVGHSARPRLRRIALAATLGAAVVGAAARGWSVFKGPYPVRTFELPDRGVWSAVPDPSGRFLAICGYGEPNAGVLDMTTGRQVIAFPTKDASGTYVARFSDDGATVAAVGADRVIRLWEVASRKLTLEHPLPGSQTSYVYSLELSPNGRYAAYYPNYDRSAPMPQTIPVHLLDVSQRSERLLSGVTVGGDARMSFSQDGLRLLVLANGGAVAAFDTLTGSLLHNASVGGLVTDACFFPGSNDRVLLAGGRLRALELTTGKGDVLPCRLPAYASALTVSPNGKRLLTVGRGPITVFDRDSGRKLVTIRRWIPWRGYVRFSADGRDVLCTDRDGTFRVFGLPDE